VSRQTNGFWDTPFLVSPLLITSMARLQALLEPFGITRYDTDGWGTYERHVDKEQPMIGKEHMQKIESKHITWRTRIKR
jgi:IS1 family transposase